MDKSDIKFEYHIKYEYRVQGRYGYWAIDLYKGNALLRMVDAFKTRKQAYHVCSELNSAYHAGLRDKQTELDNLNGVY